MASYNGHDFNTMQEEALRRMREMQQRSKSAVNTQPQTPRGSSAPQQATQSSRGASTNSGGNKNENMGQEAKATQAAVGNVQKQDIFKSLFGDVKLDTEKVMILLMMFVLYKNGSDIKLLLALGYLLL